MFVKINYVREYIVKILLNFEVSQYSYFMVYNKEKES